MDKRTHALAYARQLCSLNASAPALMPAILESLQAIVGHDVALFMWADAQGNLTNLCSRNAASPEVVARFVEHYVDSDERVYWTSFRETMLRGSSNSLGQIQPDFYRSAMYEEIWKPNRIHWGIDWTVRNGGRSLGSLRLYRERRGRRFTPSDHACLLPLLPHLARMLERSISVEEPLEMEEPSGLLILDAQGRCESMDRTGAILLFYATHPSINPTSLQWRGGAEMPPQIRRLCARLQEPGDAQAADGGITLQLHNDWGRFLLRAKPLYAASGSGVARTALSISRLAPQALLRARRLYPYQLSPRQLDVALLGCSNLT